MANKKGRRLDGLSISSPAVVRTPDPVVNSHLLCQLSYRGMASATGAKDRKQGSAKPFSLSRGRGFLVFSGQAGEETPALDRGAGSALGAPLPALIPCLGLRDFIEKPGFSRMGRKGRVGLMALAGGRNARRGRSFRPFLPLHFQSFGKFDRTCRLGDRGGFGLRHR